MKEIEARFLDIDIEDIRKKLKKDLFEIIFIFIFFTFTIYFTYIFINN